MGVKRKQHGAKFKAMAALAGDKTLAQLSSEYGVHVTMISTWKQELMKRADELFERGNKTRGQPIRRRPSIICIARLGNYRLRGIFLSDSPPSPA